LARSSGSWPSWKVPKSLELRARLQSASSWKTRFDSRRLAPAILFSFHSLRSPNSQLGFDLAINYKTDDVKAAVAAFAPEGIHHYFDNVGGAVTDAILQVQLL